MDGAGRFQEILRHIDEHLTEDLTPEILAGEAGYSTYHFCRVFQRYVGYSVMEYVRRRRLAFAAAELSSGRKLIDVALEFGFETHSGFSKAFKRSYGVPPEIYRSHASAVKPPLPDILRMKNYDVGGIVMEPKFVTRGEIKLAGYFIRTKNAEGESSKAIPDFWTAYISDGRAAKLHGADFIKNSDEYGACFPENEATGEFIYVIGSEVKDGASVPPEFYTCVLPPATYAAFATPPASGAEFSKNIQGTWNYIINDWFPSSGYEYADGCVDFELYPAKETGKEESVCEINIPVVKK